MKLQLKVIRKKYFKILLSIIIVISFGVGLLFGLINGVLSVHKSVDNFVLNNNYPDIKIITNLEDTSVLESFNKNDYKSFESRISLNTILKKQDKIISVKLSTYENINDFYIWEDNTNTSEFYDILVEKKFAQNNNINLGDKLIIKIDEKDYNFYVNKIISIPEAIVNIPINGLWVKTNDYGNVYINKNVLIEETNRLKQDLLDEVNKKEEELNNEENDKNNEFNLAKNKINTLSKEYNKYNKLKDELNIKLNETKLKKELLLALRKGYISINNYLDKINVNLDSYISMYESLSDLAKDYIDELIETKYPNLDIDTIEFLADIGYYIVENKIDEVFDPNSNINKKIKDEIEVLDTIKSIIDLEYDYHFSDDINSLMEKYRNGENVKDLSIYNELKNRLAIFSTVIGIVTDDNVLVKEELIRTILKEINNGLNKLPFDSFEDLYQLLDFSRYFLPTLYDSLKDKAKPIVTEIIDKINNSKEEIESKVLEIYNSNKSNIEIAKLLKPILIDYIKDKIDEEIVDKLKDYINETDLKPLELIDKLLKEIDSGIDELNKKIDVLEPKLKDALKLLNNSKKEYNDKYDSFKDKIQELKDEIEEKKEEINDIKGYESKFNEINIRVEDNINKEELLNRIKNNELKDIEIIDSYTYDYSPINDSINYNIVGMENVSKIIPIIFYIIILIVLFLFISLMIKQSNKEIAIYRLLGKSKNEIRLNYLINNMIISLFGIILGFIIGIFLMMYIVKYYKDFMLLPTVVYEIDFKSILISILLTIIVVSISTLLATLELDKITPIEVLNKEKYQEKKISKFTKICTKFLSPFKKFSFIIYIRNKKNLILGIICSSATVALIFTSLAYVASKDKIFNQYFYDRTNYDVQVFKSGNIDEDYINGIRKLDYIYNADLLRYFNVEIENNNKKANIIINALDNKNNYIRIYDKDNNIIKYPESGIVLEEHIANNLGLKINDFIEINGIKFKIVDLSFQGLGRINYISLNDSLNLSSTFDSIVINMDINKYEEFINKISNDDNYIYTVNNKTLREYNKIEFDSYSIPAIIIIIFSIIVGFIIIINIYSYNLIDQKKNFSMFRGFGFRYIEISNNLFIQSIIQWITSIIIGLPIGIVLSKYILKKVSSPRREYIYASGIKEIIITILLVFIYITISHLICMKNIKKINIVEEMKDRD